MGGRAGAPSAAEARGGAHGPGRSRGKSKGAFPSAADATAGARGARGPAEATAGTRGPGRGRGNNRGARPVAQPRQQRVLATRGAAEATAGARDPERRGGRGLTPSCCRAADVGDDHPASQQPAPPPDGSGTPAGPCRSIPGSGWVAAPAAALLCLRLFLFSPGRLRVAPCRSAASAGPVPGSTVPASFFSFRAGYRALPSGRLSLRGPWCRRRCRRPSVASGTPPLQRASQAAAASSASSMAGWRGRPTRQVRGGTRRTCARPRRARGAGHATSARPFRCGTADRARQRRSSRRPPTGSLECARRAFALRQSVAA